jgi:hypothetical protein
MRRVAILIGICLALGVLAIAPAGASAAAFPQCPAIDLDTGCQFLITVTDAETSIETDPTQGPYEGADDALIGIQNNSTKPITSIPLSAEIELFGFEFDGICNVEKSPAGCVVVPKDTEGKPNLTAGKPCPPETSFNCAFPPPPGQAAKSTYPSGAAAIGEGPNEEAISGYEGPTSYFAGIGMFGTFGTGTGVVHFSPALAPGKSTYFSLESPPVGGFGSSSTLTTTLSGGGQSGPTIKVLQGTPVTDSATLTGAGAAGATGPVSFNVYSDAACKTLAVSAGAAKLAGGVAGPSSAISTLGPGTYYWQAAYAGSLSSQAAASACGSEVLTVLAPTTTTTIQTGGGVTGASIPVLVGSSVTDQAHIAGPLAATATGTVTYVLYKDKKCTVAAAAPSLTGVVPGGTGLPSVPTKPKAGTYYWVASYSGDSVNAPSVSACGSEVLIVATKANLNLRAIKGCASKRRFVVHPRGPRSLKLVRVQVFINGKFVKEARLRNGGTTLSLVGLPKGTFKVEFVASTSSGKNYGDTRTFHTCIPKIKHKTKK